MSVLPKKAIAIMQATAAMDLDFTAALFPKTGYEMFMRVIVIGAAGAIGSPLVRQLRQAGHEVIGTSRSQAKFDRLRALGAEPVALDVLDANAVRAVLMEVRPDAVIHEATDLANLADFKHFDRSFSGTNRLRTEGTHNLLAAAREAGVRRFVAQS